jgi:hypothetical protein
VRLTFRTDSEHLGFLLNDLPGWQNLAIRSLSENSNGPLTDRYEVVLTTKQVQKLGEMNIRTAYEVEDGPASVK